MADRVVALGRQPARLAVLAASLGMAGLAVTVVGLLVWAGQGLGRLPSGSITQIPLLPAVAYTAAGALLAARLPANPVGWLFMVAGLALTFVLPVELLVAAAHEAFRPASAFTSHLTWLVSSFSTPVLIGSLAVAGLLFPDGLYIAARWRWVSFGAVVAALALGLSVGLDPEGLMWYPTIANPFRADVSAGPVLAVVRALSLVMLVVALAAVVVVQATRYRRGDAVTRAQLRWVMSAATVMAVAAVPFLVVRYTDATDDTLMWLLVAVNQVTLVLLPMAAAIAIMRYHLFGIDVLISRTLVYVPLMGALGGLYALAVTVFQRVFVALTGETSDTALLIAVFLIAAVFTPLRKALEGVVDRHMGTEPTPESSTSSRAPAQEADELQQTAARLIALRRLEERLAHEPVAAGPQSGRRLDIVAGLVSCPHGPAVPFMSCLGCQHLVAMTTSPATIICDGPAAADSVP